MNKKQIFSTLLSVFISLVLVCTVVYASSTIGHNVTVGGTLGVTGASTLNSLIVTVGTNLNGVTYLGDTSADLISVPGTINTALIWAATTTTYGLDMALATMTTDIRLDAGATIANTTDTLTITEGTTNFVGNVTVGSDGSGHDVTFHSDDATAYALWDSSEHMLKIWNTYNED